ncbi:MAG TPA: tetratricopeptide repeat protein [Burkholderiales bacterium]|nr:tetratricopeptide repeat protein [Burkholderiales bacterium]
MSLSIQRKVKQAQQRMQQGDVAGAEQLCQQVLQQAPRNPEALWIIGVIRLMNGQASEAVSALEQVVAVSPRHGAALESLGLARLMLGEFAEAERVLRTAAALPGAPASVPMRLGLAILNQNRPAEAIAHLERALRLDPRSSDARLNMGLALARSGDMQGAEQRFHEVLREAPDHPDALFNLGVLHLEREEWEAAQQWFEKALQCAPQFAGALVNLGIALRKRGALMESEAALRRAIAIEPNLPAAGDNLAQTLAMAGRLVEAREQYLATLRLAPQLLSAREGLAAVCFALHRFQEALPHLHAILEAEPDNVRALTALGEALYQSGRLDEALAAAQRANALDATAVGPYSILAQLHLVRGELEPGAAGLEQCWEATRSPALLGLLTYQLRRLCEWTRWRTAWENTSHALAQSADVGSPFFLLCEATTAKQQLDYSRAWSERRFGKSAPVTPSSRRTVREGRRIRLGYLTSDFYQQPVGYLIAELMELHDRERFEIFAYSYGPDDGSAIRHRLQNAFEHFIDIAREPDDVAYHRIRDDAVDILVDLHGYTAGDRLTIMAQRPCDIQVTWLGYPCTTGASFIDYLIADPFIVPAGQEAAYCSERVLRMPHCYQPNDRKRAIGKPLERSAYGLPADGLVFCCFNQLLKITPDVFACWMRLLRDIPKSVLWLLDDHPVASRNLRLEAQRHGVDESRVVFAGRVPLAEHLARYYAADIALDTFPYTSHTTASDALWTGCPLLGLCGETFAARVSGSILTAGGLPDLLTYDLEQYYSLALRVATTPSLLAELRQRVDAARSSAALFDMERFARDLEALYCGVL